MVIHGDCILGRSDIEETSANPNPGIYIDISNPASCSGQITQWNLCYYNPRLFSNFGNNLQIDLQVWRFDSQVQRGTLVDIHVATMSIPQQPEDFQCTSIELSQDDYMDIRAGDFLGVRLTFNFVLPVVNNYGQSNLPAPMIVFVPSTLLAVTEINRQNDPGVVLVTSNGIHVTANIGKFLNHWYEWWVSCTSCHPSLLFQ